MPFSRQEIGQFCIALAIEDLITDGGHVMRTLEDVLREVDDLRRAGYVRLLAAGWADDFAEAIRDKRTVAMLETDIWPPHLSSLTRGK